MVDTDRTTILNQSAGAYVAPRLDYAPARASQDHGVGMIGCGAISAHQLAAYQCAALPIVALCDRHEERALARQREYFPKARVYTDYRKMLESKHIDVVDITTHPAQRESIVTDALNAGKHVLSQKPFADNLDTALRLIDLAARCDRRLAVNFGGRWAPDMRYMKKAIEAGLIGRLESVSFVAHFDHNWIAGTAFDGLNHVLLYDFGIHLFDLTCNFFGRRKPLKVYAHTHRASSQTALVPLIASAVIDIEDGISTIVLDGNTRVGQRSATTLVGSSGTLHSIGPNLAMGKVSLHTDRGTADVDLEGSWLQAGFEGTLSELLCSIEQGREPEHSARSTLPALEIAFAATESANAGEPRVPGDVRQVG